MSGSRKALQLNTTTSNVDVDHFMRRVEQDFAIPEQCTQLLKYSIALEHECYHELRAGDLCMLPSFIAALPNGDERGSFLALDVGGSNFRVALIDLSSESLGNPSTSIVCRVDHSITLAERALKGQAFFDWMAGKIVSTLQIYGQPLPDPLHAGVSWSFPIRQTSSRNAVLLQMGKNFKAFEGLVGKDVGDLIMNACAKKVFRMPPKLLKIRLTCWSQRLDIQIDSIVNDSSASLIAGAYHNASTRIAVILGTGLNASIYLPTSSLAAAKFGDRLQSWRPGVSHVLINTELSMFGAHILPKTPWDDILGSKHPNPSFQPLEHLVGGRYLGELVRLVLLDGIETARIFSGHVPNGFDAYGLSTETISIIESDNSALLASAASVLNTRHPLRGGRQYTYKDILTVRRIAHLVSSRAAAYLAVAIYALCNLCRNAENALHQGHYESEAIGCAGSVLEKYPLFRERTQMWMSRLAMADGRCPCCKTVLNLAADSALNGAALAAATATRATTANPERGSSELDTDDKVD